MAPAEEPIHPNKLMPPKTAREAGSKNTPEPIMLPTTSEVVVHKPILAGDLAGVMNDSQGVSQCVSQCGKVLKILFILTHFQIKNLSLHRLHQMHLLLAYPDALLLVDCHPWFEKL